MTSAHLTVVTPGRCGLYETTRELVTGLRAKGIDARLVDPTRDTNTLYPSGDTDRGAPLADMAFATSADVIVNHSGFDGTPVEHTTQPVVHVAHGRPRSSFLSEANGKTPIYSYHYQKNRDPRFKAVVTFWPQHVGYLKVMWPDVPVRYVPASVDLEAWTPEGPSGYRFNGHKGAINLVCTDAWRDDIDPFVAVNAVALYARQHAGVKLHCYGTHGTNAKGWAPLFRRLRDDGTLGDVKGWVRGLAHVYRAADALITAHEIDVRSVREAMACGCPVARVTGTSLDGSALAIDQALARSRRDVRREAEWRFAATETATAFAAVLESV